MFLGCLEVLGKFVWWLWCVVVVGGGWWWTPTNYDVTPTWFQLNFIMLGWTVTILKNQKYMWNVFQVPILGSSS